MCVEGFRHNQELNPTKENGLKREIDYRSGRKPVTIAPMLLKSRQLYKERNGKQVLYTSTWKVRFFHSPLYVDIV